MLITSLVNGVLKSSIPEKWAGEQEKMWYDVEIDESRFWTLH